MMEIKIYVLSFEFIMVMSVLFSFKDTTLTKGFIQRYPSDTTQQYNEFGFWNMSLTFFLNRSCSI